MLLLIGMSALLVGIIQETTSSEQNNFCQSLPFKYHNSSFIGEHFLQMQNHFPEYARRYSIGKSNKKRDLWVLELSTPHARETLGTPNVKYIGDIHGNEVVAGEVLFQFTHYLICNFERNKTIQILLNSTRIHILPIMNPDGFFITKPERFLARKPGEHLCDYNGRMNYKRMDLNRNFPTPLSSNLNPQKEMIAITKWMEHTRFVLSGALHAGTLVANYPYDDIYKIENITFQNSITPDDDVFIHLANVYARAHPDMWRDYFCPKDICSSNKFSRPPSENGIVNGAKWYRLGGGMQDYNYIFGSCMELTLEISCEKYPNVTGLEETWIQNQDALILFAKEAQKGVRGVIRSSEGTLLNEVSLTIKNREFAAFWSSNEGEFWRILLPGKYQLEVKRAFYIPQSIEFIVKENNFTWLNIELILKNSTLNHRREITTPSTTKIRVPQIKTVAPTSLREPTTQSKNFFMNEMKRQLKITSTSKPAEEDRPISERSIFNSTTQTRTLFNYYYLLYLFFCKMFQ